MAGKSGNDEKDNDEHAGEIESVEKNEPHAYIYIPDKNQGSGKGERRTVLVSKIKKFDSQIYR